MAAALGHVLAGRDTEAQWEEAVGLLGGMNPFEQAMVWVRLAESCGDMVAMEQCRLVFDLAVSDAFTRKIHLHTNPGNPSRPYIPIPLDDDAAGGWNWSRMQRPRTPDAIEPDSPPADSVFKKRDGETAAEFAKRMQEGKQHSSDAVGPIWKPKPKKGEEGYNTDDTEEGADRMPAGYDTRKWVEEHVRKMMPVKEGW